MRNAIMSDKGKIKLRAAGTEERLRIVFAGDFCPTSKAETAICAGGADAILAKIKPYLDRADLRVIQWETTLADTPSPILKAGPALNSPTGCVDFMLKGNFDIALLANNHIGDQGVPGVMSTLESIQKAGRLFAGVGINAVDAARPLHFERNGITVSLLNACEEEFGGAGDNTPGANLMDAQELPDLIRGEAKNVDLVIAVLHGGHENYPLPSPRMKKLHRSFARAGAAAVVNIHTHVPLGMECYNGVPIIYSPGNFFFPHRFNEYDPKSFWWSGYLPFITFDKTGAVELEIVPYTFTEKQIVPLQGDARRWFLEHLERLSGLLQTDCERLFDAWCAKVREPFLNYAAAAPFRELAESYNDPAILERLPVIRHLLTCQSHCDLLKNLTLMIENHRMDCAIADIPELDSLMDAHFEQSL